MIIVSVEEWLSPACHDEAVGGVEVKNQMLRRVGLGGDVYHENLGKYRPASCDDTVYQAAPPGGEASEQCRCC